MIFPVSKIPTALLAFIMLLLNPVGAYSQEFVKRSLISGFSTERWQKFGAFDFDEASEYQHGPSLPLLIELARMGAPEVNFVLAQLHSYPFLTDFSLNTDHEKRNAYLHEASKKGSISAKELLIYSDLKVLLAMTHTFPECGAQTANSDLELHNRLIEIIISDDLRNALDGFCVVDNDNLTEVASSLKGLSQALYDLTYDLFKIRHNSQNARENLTVSFVLAAVIDFIATAASSNPVQEDLGLKIRRAFTENCSDRRYQTLTDVSPKAVLSVFEELQMSQSSKCILGILQNDEFFSVFDDKWNDVPLFLIEYMFKNSDEEIAGNDMLPRLFQWWHEVLGKSLVCNDDSIIDFDIDENMVIEFKYYCGDKNEVTSSLSRPDFFPDKSTIHVSMFDNLLFLLSANLVTFGLPDEIKSKGTEIFSGLKIDEENVKLIAPYVEWMVPVRLLLNAAAPRLSTSPQFFETANNPTSSLNPSIEVIYNLARDMYLETFVFAYFGPLVFLYLY